MRGSWTVLCRANFYRTPSGTSPLRLDELLTNRPVDNWVWRAMDCISPRLGTVQFADFNLGRVCHRVCHELDFRAATGPFAGKRLLGTAVARRFFRVVRVCKRYVPDSGGPATVKREPTCSHQPDIRPFCRGG